MDGFSEKIDSLRIKISEGDFDALDQLYRDYFSKLKLYGLQFAQKLDSYSIDDTIQELFITIAKKHTLLKEVKNLEVYLFSALKQNIYQEISRKENHKKIKNKYFQSTTSNSNEISVERKFIESEDKMNRRNYVTNLLESLPPNQKEVIYLRNYINMSYAEIAQVMNLSEQVVRNYAYRAMTKLRAQPAPGFIQKNRNI